MGETSEEQSQEHAYLYFFFTSRGLVLAGQTVNSEYYYDVLRRLRENLLRLCLELWRQKNWLLHHDNTPSHTSFFPREVLTKNKTVVSTYPTFPCFLD
jgi:hypothetical protein